MNKLLIICGPTGTGKTKLAIHLAKKFGGELVNADSRQIFKGLDALTGKDRSEEVPIRLYDVAEPGEEFSVAHFVRLAHDAICQIHARKKLPIVVGGTGFYLRALTSTIDTLHVPPNRELRNKFQNASVAELAEKLRRVEPGKWEKMNESDRKNPRRLIRAIEVAAAATPAPSITPPSDVLWIGLRASLPILKERIARRVAERFEKAAREVCEGLPPILGVEPLLSFARGQIQKEEAMKQWIQAEYACARRQMTWFRKVAAIRWFDITDREFESKVEDAVEQWYTHTYHGDQS